MAGRKALKMKANKKDSMRSAAISGKDARQSSAGGDHEAGGHGINGQGVVAIGEGGGHTGKGKGQAAESEGKKRFHERGREKRSAVVCPALALDISRNVGTCHHPTPKFIPVEKLAAIQSCGMAH